MTAIRDVFEIYPRDRRIAVPLSRPGLVTLGIVNTLWVWNELLIAIVFLQRSDKRTLMAGLTLFPSTFLKSASTTP